MPCAAEARFVPWYAWPAGALPASPSAARMVAASLVMFIALAPAHGGAIRLRRDDAAGEPERSALSDGSTSVFTENSPRTRPFTGPRRLAAMRILVTGAAGVIGSNLLFDPLRAAAGSAG